MNREINSVNGVTQNAFQSPDQKPFHPNFVENPGLNTIIHRIETSQVNWEKIIRILGNPPYTLNNLDKGLTAEVHVRTVLEELKDEFGERLKLDPIPDGTQVGDYLFMRRDHQLFVQNLIFKRDVAEYDMLIEIDGQPVLFDISMGRGKNAGYDNLSDEKINRRFEPLAAYYETYNFSHVLLLGHESATFTTRPSRSKNYVWGAERFMNHGGKIARLPRELQEIPINIRYAIGNHL